MTGALHASVGTVETRSAAALAASAAGRTLVGLIPFGVRADLGDYTEEIAPGAFDGCDLGELVAVTEHDDGRLLARYPGTLAVEIVGDGLRWTAELPDTREADEVRTLVRRGDLAACSWRMVVAADRWHGNHRVIERIARLLDVGPVTRPAYGTAAAVELRSQTAGTTTKEAHMGTETAPPSGDYRVAGTVSLTAAEDEATPAETESRSVPAGSGRLTAPTGGGGLRVESRSAVSEGGSIESRIVEAARSVQRGEARSLTAASAGAVMPEQLDQFVWDLLRTQSAVLASGVKVISPTTATVRLPRITSDADASFYPQAGPITPDDPGLDEIEVKPKALKSLVYGASEAFDDSSPDLLNLLRSHLIAVHAARLDDEFINGDGTGNGFVGLIETPSIRTFDADGLPLFAALTRAAGALRADGGGEAVALAHPWSVVDADLTRDDAGAGAGTGSWLPRPVSAPEVIEAARLPLDAAAGTASALVYLPQRIVVARRQDTLVEVDRSAEFGSDQVGVRARTRATIAVPDPKSVVLVTNVAAPDPLA